VVIRVVERDFVAEDDDDSKRVKVHRGVRGRAVLTEDDESGETEVDGLGSGVLISSDGKILTAAHVVQTAEKVEVQFVDGTRQAAKILASVPYADVALIKVDGVPPAARPAVLGDSDKMQVGDRVFVVGAPFELSYTLTAGYISGRRDPEPIKGPLSSMELFQTDAAINKGNSGGPMFNMKGEVIGICSHILTESGGFEGMGFAVTSDYARKVLLDSPAIWTGIDGHYVDDEVAALLNVPQRAGILVMRIAKNSPATALGLQAGKFRVKIHDQDLVLGGDIILSVDGISVGEKGDVMAQIEQSLGRAKAGDVIRMTVLRAGKVVPLQGKLPGGKEPPG
jgi:S1-C subfamily serine protease